MTPSPPPILVHRVIARLNIGGPAIHVVNLSRGMDETGAFRTRLLAGKITTDEGDMAYYARERGVEVVALPALSRLVSPLQDLKILWALFRTFRREHPLIVHTHTAKAGTLGRVAAVLAGVPVRIHTFHGHVLGGAYFPAWLTRFYLEIERQLARISQRLVVLTESQKRKLAGELGVAPEERFRVIPLGLELGAFAAVERETARKRKRAELGLAEDETVVGIVGRLVPVKNHGLLFRAQPLLEKALGKPARILVVGGGLMEAELSGLAGELGIRDRVSWLGWRQDLPDLYAAMDVLALTSLDEGTPVALLEALAAGTPVAARAVGGVGEMLEGVPLARLIPEDSPRAVAEGLLAALKLTTEGPGLTDTRRRIVERYATERLVREMAALYLEELEGVGVV